MILFAYIVGRTDQAIDLALDCLVRMGVTLPRSPTADDVEREYRAFAQRLENREIETIFDLPQMSAPHWLDVMGILEGLLGPVASFRAEFLDLLLLRMANISLDHGLSHEACHVFVNLGARLLGWRFGSFEDGHRFGQVTMRMMEERGFDRYAARVYAIVSGVVAPWNQPLREAYDIARRAIDMPRERGGIGYAGYAWVCGLTALLDSGRLLNEVERLSEAGIASARKYNFTLVVEFISAQQKLIRALRGERGAADQALAGFSDPAYEAYLESAPNLIHAMTRYHVRKLQFLVYAGRSSEALAILEKLGGNLGQSPILLQSPVFEVVEYCFFSALARRRAPHGYPAWGLGAPF